jgi:hypothetical protein
MILTSHHSITDAQSNYLVLDALKRAYGGAHIQSLGSFREHVRLNLMVNHAEREQYWKMMFDQFEPFSLPIIHPADQKTEMYGSLEKIIKFDQNLLYTLEKTLGVTRAVVLQSIWALLLFKFSRSTTVVFGSVISGREQDIDESN